MIPIKLDGTQYWFDYKKKRFRPPAKKNTPRRGWFWIASRRSYVFCFVQYQTQVCGLSSWFALDSRFVLAGQVLQRRGASRVHTYTPTHKWNIGQSWLEHIHTLTLSHTYIERGVGGWGTLIRNWFNSMKFVCTFVDGATRASPSSDDFLRETTRPVEKPGKN